MKRALLLALSLLVVGSPALSHSRWLTVATTVQTTDATLATPSSITGLSFPVLGSQRYAARCYIVSTSADATTGIRYSVTGPAAATAVTFAVTTFSAAATTLSEAFGAFSFTSAATASILTTRHINRVDMMLRNGVNGGTVQLTINPEADTSVTAEIGSWCEYRSEFP